MLLVFFFGILKYSISKRRNLTTTFQCWKLIFWEKGTQNAFSYGNRGFKKGNTENFSLYENRGLQNKNGKVNAKKNQRDLLITKKARVKQYFRGNCGLQKKI